MRTSRILLIGLILAAAAAHAQYQWVDKDGRRVFSDRPPPADVPAKNVLTQPKGARAPQATAAVGPSASASASSACACAFSSFASRVNCSTRA